MLGALRERPLGAETLASLATSVTAGQTPAQSDGDLLLLLSAHPEGGGPVRAMLQAMLARNESDLAMQGRIRHVLAQTL